MNFQKKTLLKRRIPFLIIISISLLFTNVNYGTASGELKEKYSWESMQARATGKGDLLWTPKPFIMKKGKSIRYIDFVDGKDSNDGKTKSTPWKHHPGDPNASGVSASSEGIDTYIFKKGVVYRGTVTIKESGFALNPVRLTSDPSWGKGEAAIYGSVKITGGWKKGADNKDIPSASEVWYRDLDFSPRTLWMVNDKEVFRIPLARIPNWKISDPEDVKSEWWMFDFPGDKYFNVYMKSDTGKDLVMGIDTKHLTGPKEMFMGAIVWNESGWVDGTPYPSYVQGFDAEKKVIGFDGFLGSLRDHVHCRYHRYFLEDKPHFLDDPDGEYWFDKRGTGGRLYLIPPGGKDPNTIVIEAGKETTLIDIEDKENIEISGLSFRYTNQPWEITGLWKKGHELIKEMWPASVRVWGGGYNIKVSNCSFRHVNEAVLMKAAKHGKSLDGVSVTDCDIRETDNGGITIHEGIEYEDVLSEYGGLVYDVKVLRNYVSKAGQRSLQRIGSSNAIDVANGQTMEIAGNIVDRPWHAGLYIRCAKLGGNYRDVPLSRVLIYQNKVTNGIRTGDDCGNIETWQGGAAYVFNNHSGNPGGIRNAAWMFSQAEPEKWGSARFGMAYYLDGSFKNYCFNNIGWGLSKDPRSREGATTMFQEIISYQNMFFNNTAYNFIRGTRRQAPQAGRNKYLGNIWESIGEWVFWHTTPAKSKTEGNEKDAGPSRSQYFLETNAFTGNIFHDIIGKYSSFKPSGQWHETLEESKKALKEVGSITSDLGIESESHVLKDPAERDFGLTNNSAAVDKGAKVFVPWSLFASVAEWNFYPAGNDPYRIIDEHWYMTDYYYNRDNFYRIPMFDLKGVNIDTKNYIKGPLEDWVKGALKFNGKNQYAFCSDSSLNDTLSYNVNIRKTADGYPLVRKIRGKDFKSPEVYDSNFLVEVYFKTKKGATNGVLVEKYKDSGYSVEINALGQASFKISDGREKASLSSMFAINDGEWHHLIAEADRNNTKITLYIDGKKHCQGSCFPAGSSIENFSNLYVGGTPSGRCLNGAIDFLRICLGTLADAKTDIKELYAWEFDGPFLKDFTGRRPNGKRDAGALENRD